MSEPDTEPFAVESPSAPVAPPITPAKMAEEDRLAVENIYLRMQNVQLQMVTLDARKALLAGTMQELQQEMERKNKALSDKYGLAVIDRTTVAPDGTIKRP